MDSPDNAPTLLVVDDDPQILPLIERHARQLGFRVVLSSGGKQALDSFDELKPDVALVDRQMPDLGGLDVLRAIRAQDPDCQIILMTGDATLESAIEAVKAGALDYLTKPFDFARLRDL